MSAEKRQSEDNFISFTGMLDKDVIVNEIKEDLNEEFNSFKEDFVTKDLLKFEISAREIADDAIKNNLNKLDVKLNELISVKGSNNDEDDVFYIKNSLYPEFFLTEEEKKNIRYSKPYHLYPLVWYGGEVNGVLISKDAYNGNVFKPSECIYHKYSEIIDQSINTFCNWDVKLDTKTNMFVLDVGGVYYKEWNNSYVYNNPQYNCPNAGTLYACYKGSGSDDTTVFNNISKRPDVKLWDGSKWVYDVWNTTTNKWEGTLFGELTDFSEAIKKCIAYNNGNLLLRPNKTYFCKGAAKNGSIELAVTSKENFIIDGNGSTILCRKPITSNSDSVNNYLFAFNKCKHGIIRNLTVAGIRDNNGGGPSLSTQKRLSIASSNMSLCTVKNSNENLSFEDITTYGMHFDIHIKNTPSSYASVHNKNISYKNIKGILTVGNVIRDVDNLLIDNYDMLQDGCANSGEHVVYFQGGPGNVIFRNSKIRPSDRYIQLLFSHHAGGQTSENSLQNCIFEGCDISGMTLFGVPFGNQRIQFINSVIRVPYNTAGGANSVTTKYSQAMGNYSGQYDFINCTIYAPGKFMGKGGSNTYYPRFNISGCTFIRNYKEDGTIDRTTPFFDKGFNGTYTLNNTKVYIPRNEQEELSMELLSNDEALKLLGLGVNKQVPTDSFVADFADKINTTIYGIDTTVLPTTPPDENDMVNGDMWYDVEKDIINKCIEAGKPSKIAFGILRADKYWNNITYTGYTELKIPVDNGFETIRIPKSDTYKSVAKTNVVQVIDDALTANGYTKVSTKTAFNEPGQYFVEYTNSNSYLYVYTKSRGILKSFGTVDMSQSKSSAASPPSNYTSFIYGINKNLCVNGGKPKIVQYKNNGIEQRVKETEDAIGLVLTPIFDTVSPQNPTIGDYWYDTNKTDEKDNGLKKFDGDKWVSMDTNTKKMRIMYNDGALYLSIGGQINKTLSFI